MAQRQHADAVLARIQDDLRALMERARAPEDVRGFLLDRWALLLAGIRVHHDESHPDWLAGWETVHALLWSLAPKQGAEEARQLLGLLPLLVERLHDGCNALHVGKTECDAFFSQLAMLHAAAVRAGVHPETASGREDAGKGLADAAEMARRDAEAEPAPEESLARASLDRRADALVEALNPGAWVDFHDAEGQRPLRLHWVSAMRGMFLFTDADGYQALSLTRARFKERLASGEARIHPT
jgi:hypothetical protein